MMHERLLKLEREAEQRVREAHDREIDLGGPGSTRRASAAMDAPMLEAAAIRKMRQRLGDVQMEIDYQKNLLRKTRRNSDLSPEIRRHRVGQAETKLSELGDNYKALEAEAADRFFPEQSKPAPARRARAAGLVDRPSHDIRVASPSRAGVASRRGRPGPAIDRLLGRQSPPVEQDEPAPMAPDDSGRRKEDAGKAKAASQTGAVVFPGGAELRPAMPEQAQSIDWSNLGKSLLSNAPRYASAVAAGLSVALTPWNDQGGYNYLSDDERLHLAPGDLYGPLEKRDPRTGEWRRSDRIGMIVYDGKGEGAKFLTGTRDQVDRAAREFIFGGPPARSQPESLTAAPSGREAPESFPAEDQGPTVLVTPGEERGPTVLSTPGEAVRMPDIPGFSKPEHPSDVVEVFPDQSAILPQFIVLENRRGDSRTQDLNADVAGIGRDIAAEDDLGVNHVGGGRTNKGADIKETYLPNRDNPGSTTGSNYLDITFQGRATKRRLLVNTVDIRASGRPTGRERRAAVRILYNKKSGDLLVLIPKPAAGQTIDRAKLKEFLRPLLREIDRPHEAGKADAPSTIEWQLWSPGK